MSDRVESRVGACGLLTRNVGLYPFQRFVVFRVEQFHVRSTYEPGSFRMCPCKTEHRRGGDSSYVSTLGCQRPPGGSGTATSLRSTLWERLGAFPSLGL